MNITNDSILDSLRYISPEELRRLESVAPLNLHTPAPQPHGGDADAPTFTDAYYSALAIEQQPKPSAVEAITDGRLDAFKLEHGWVEVAHTGARYVAPKHPLDGIRFNSKEFS